MRNIIIILILLATSMIYAQDCSAYDNLIAEGNTAFSNSNYERAVKRYNLAMLNCPEKTAEVQKKILGVFREIERLKIQAEEQKETLEAEQAKNRRIINSLYFYANRFALAYKNGNYGFIDKEGNTTIEYTYDDAKPFENNGYAKVKRYGIYYLIDTLGTEYQITHDANQLNENISALDLQDKRLKFIPAKIFRNTQLQILFLSKNQLTSLPAEIKQLKQLKYLNLYDNQLTSLPVEIGQLRQLKYLNLYDNQLTSLPAEIGQLKQLKYLNLSKNQLSALLTAIGQLKQLKYLNLYDNQLTSLPAEIGQLEGLQELHLNDNQLNSLPTEITQLKKLLYLQLKNNNFSNQEKEKIKKLLPNCKIVF